MAVINPPLWLQAGAYNARQDRRLISSFIKEGGVAGPTDLVVTQRGAGANMSVDVAEGRAFIFGTEATTQGAYHVETQGATNVVVGAAHATLARYDLIVARVRDAEYSGATNAWALEVVAGTPAGSPAEPTVPANAIVLARVTVAAAVTSILNAVILDRRPRARTAGGISTATSTTLPSLLGPVVEGDMVYATDTNTYFVLVDSAWRPVGGPVYLRAGSAWTAVASPTYNPVTGASITLPPGGWLIQGYMGFGVLTGTNRFVYLRMQNITAGTTLDLQNIGHPPGHDFRPTPTVTAAITLTASATIRLEASVDAIDGFQNHQYSKIWASPATALL